MEIKEVKDLSKDLEKFSRTLSEAANNMNSVTKDMKNLKKLIGTVNEENSLESKLIATGIACIISPDPVSDAAGVVMVITGTLLRKVRETKIVDIIKESKRLRSNLEKITKYF